MCQYYTFITIMVPYAFNRLQRHHDEGFIVIFFFLQEKKKYHNSIIDI